MDEVHHDYPLYWVIRIAVLTVYTTEYNKEFIVIEHQTRFLTFQYPLLNGGNYAIFRCFISNTPCCDGWAEL